MHSALIMKWITLGSCKLVQEKIDNINKKMKETVDQIIAIQVDPQLLQRESSGFEEIRSLQSV